MSDTLRPRADRPEVIDRADRPEVEDWSEDDAYTADPRVVETRAMDLAELAVEVTARPDAEPADVVPPRSSIDIALDPPRYADDPEPDDPSSEPVVDPTMEPGVDPRIEERRSGVASERRRRRRRAFLAVVAVVVLAGAGYVLLHSPLLDVDTISVVGSDRLSLDELEDRTGVGIGSPLAFVDPAAVEAELRKDPRFVRVVVNRTFPSSLSVRLTDRRAIAVVVGPTRGVVVGEDGVIIAVARGDEFLQHVEVQDDPPTEVGSRLPPALAAAVDVMGSMSFEIAVQIRKMSITAEGELVFDLGEDRTVLFGTVDDAERKLLATRTMLGPQIDLRGVCRLDVRVPTAPTMRRDPDCDPPPPPTVPAVDPAVDPAAPAATDAAVPPPSGDPAAPPSTGDPAADAVVGDGA